MIFTTRESSATACDGYLCGVAEDVTSEVFLKVVRQMPSFRGTTHYDFVGRCDRHE